MDDPDIQASRFKHRGGVYHAIDVRSGFQGFDRIVPPAGEMYAFYRPRYLHHVQVTVSPTGRSVQVFMDGEKLEAVSDE